ncbi:MAG: acyl-CoA desaturase [Flavobacteriales bacterium]|jgi:linoleoyl-CoA desaturase|nr:acyl-CoA desaturase [Flavobacteriales bacterium]
MNTIRFNHSENAEFVKVLRKRVNNYFKENKITKYANFNMKLKTVVMLTIYFLPLILMLTGVVQNIWLIGLLWGVMGVGMAGIGFSVMHDANHGTYSKNQKVNQAIAFVISLIGGSSINWKIQHNVLHHSYTNIQGHDEDIDLEPLLRLAPSQKRYKIHRFQVFYVWILYSIMTLYWFSVKDFDQIKRYKNKDLLKGQGITFNKALLGIIGNKILYVGVLLALPLIFVNIPWWQTIIGFVIMHIVCGLMLSTVFQCAHVVEETAFFTVDENSSMENNWAVHQMKTTLNFAQKNRVLSWFIGGLNFQIEHHLFPNICHVHYRKISKIVRETAKEFQLPYHTQNSFWSALRSHVVLLNKLGLGKI